MDIIEFFKREWHTLKSAPLAFIVIAMIAGVVGWRVADYHYDGRIQSLKETLETKEFPKPSVRTIAVPVPDPKQTDHIASLEGALIQANNTIASLVQTGGTKAPAKMPVTKPAPTTSSSNQSGGITLGAGGSVGTFNQNGIPARSAFAVPLGTFYTQGYIILQQASVLGQSDQQILDLTKQFMEWRAGVVTWMNANMCSDAAAYLLKSHRASMSWSGVSENQNHLIDIASWTLDNLSDIKRNDAWDCK